MAIFGPDFYAATQATGVTTYAIDSTTDGIAYVLSVPEDATITNIVIRQGVVTGTSPVYKIGFQTLGSDGLPDGTFTGGGSEESTTFTPVAGNDSTAQVHTLDNAKAVSRGNILCVVIAYSSGTVDGSNNCSFVRQSASSVATSLGGFPYSLTQSVGTWTKEDDPPFIILRSATTSYGMCWDTTSFLSFRDNIDPDEVGMAFTVPSGLTTDYRVVGVTSRLTQAGTETTTTLTVTLYENTTALQTVVVTGNRRSGTQSENYGWYFDEATLSTLTPGTEYIVALKSSSTVNNISLSAYNYLTSGDLQARLQFAGSMSGIRWLAPRYMTRNNGGAWSATATRLAPIVPVISAMTATAGGGGGLKLVGTGGLAG